MSGYPWVGTPQGADPRRGVRTMNQERSVVTDATRQAEAEEARVSHVADSAATPEEEESVEERAVDDNVRDHYREMTEIGANEVGEGRVP